MPPYTNAKLRLVARLKGGLYSWVNVSSMYIDFRLLNKKAKHNTQALTSRL